MQDYKEYQAQLKQAETEEKNSSDAVEYFMPAGFLVIFCLISAGATYYLNHTGIAASPLYQRFVSPVNAALLILVILEGSFIALSLLGHKILKSEEQRHMGKFGLWALKIVLSLNILVAFLHLLKITTAPMLEAYAQFGAPVTIIGAGFLWSYIVAHRRKTKMRNQLLDDSAKVQTLWAEQYRKDQARYRATYNTIAESDEMQSLREQIAVRHAIEQIAIQSGLTFDEAARSYHEMKSRQRDAARFGPAQAEWRSQDSYRLTPAVTHSLPSRPAPVVTTAAAPSSVQLPAPGADLTDEELRLIQDVREGKIRSH
jgi:hypothetical protein